MKVEQVPIGRFLLGEGAIWDPVDQALYFLDIFGQKVLRYDPANGTSQYWQTPGKVGAMGLREGGGAILAMGGSLYTLDFDSGEFLKIAGPVFDTPDVTVNDGSVDAAGRFVFGGCCAGLEAPRPIGGLFSLGCDGMVRKLDAGIHQSNSHCFAPDGRTLYCADSFTNTAYAYDYDVETGDVSGKRVLIDTQDLGGCPDGSAVDADGLVWMSIFKAGKVAAVRPDGRVERIVDVPARLVSSVTFGGPNLDLLYVTTIDPSAFGWPAEEGGGHVYAIEGLGTRGTCEHRYRG